MGPDVVARQGGVAGHRAGAQAGADVAGFRLFISSTFRDFVAERDALHEQVFPWLARFCASRGMEFQVVDLRWGVTEAAGLEQTTVDICLREIARCKQTGNHPNFLFLLGDRYGWRPLPTSIPADEFDRILERLRSDDAADERVPPLLEHWYPLDRNAIPAVRRLRPRRGAMSSADRWAPVEAVLRSLFDDAAAALDLPHDRRSALAASTTEQEINAGVFDDPSASQSVIGIFRSIQGLPADRQASDFLDVDASGTVDVPAQRRLRRLEARLRGFLPPSRTFSYAARWTGEGITGDHLSAICGNVRGVLERSIDAAARRPERIDLKVVEDAAQREFALRRAAHFTGRASHVRRIERHLAGTKRRALVVHGEAGTGKSALLARVVVGGEAAAGPTALLYRFIGATSASSRGDRLLAGICADLQRILGTGAAEVPAGVDELGEHLRRLLSQARAERPVAVVVDGLDQLAPDDEARRLAWVPQQLPPHVRFVVSTLPGECLDRLRGRLPADCFLELGPMSAGDGKALLGAWLRAAGRTLTPDQRRSVLGEFATSGRPLHLRLAFEEARWWRSDDRPVALGRDVDSVVRRLFRRLARDSNYGPVLVARSLAYLASSREGLSETEMVDLLSRDSAVLRDLHRLSPASPKVDRLPPNVWSRYHHDLASYLIERSGSHGLPLLGFLHRQLAEVVQQDYLHGSARRARHRHLARYFADRPTRPDPADGARADVRKLVELPYHECHAELWRELAARLVDPDFVDAKVAALGPQAVIDDFELGLRRGLGSNPGTRRARDAVEAIHRALVAGAHHLVADPRQLWPQLFGRLQARPVSLVGRFLADGRAQRSQPWLRPLTASLQASGHLLRTIPAHDAVVLTAALSADGRLAASTALQQPEVRVWELATGRLVRRIPAATHALAMSGDGSRLLIGMPDGSVEVSEPESGARLRTRRVHRKAVTALVAMAGDAVIFSGHADAAVRRWDLRTDQVTDVLPPGRGQVVAITASADGNRVVALLRHRFATRLVLWDDQQTRSLDNPGHVDAVNAVALSPDGRRALSGAASGDDTVRLWMVDSGRILAVLRHRGPVRSVAFLPRSRAVSASGSNADSTARVWDLATGREEARLDEHTGGVNDVVMAADGRLLLSAGHDGMLKVWDVRASRSRAGPARHEGPVNDVAVTPDGRHAVTASGDGTLKWWETATGRRLRTVRWSSPFDEVISMRVAISPDGRWGASAALDEPILVWETGGRVRHRLAAEPVMWNWVNAMVFDPHSGRLFSAGNDGFVHAWNVAFGSELWRGGDPDDETTALAVTPDGRWLIGGSTTGRLTLWDAENGTELGTVDAGAAPVRALAVTPDGAKLASSAGGLFLWRQRPERGRGGARSAWLVPLLADRDHAASDIDIAPDGRWAASSAGDLRMWDLRDGEVVARFAGDSPIGCCAFANQGKVIVCGESSGRVHFLGLR
jgi:WD40 repeat protein